VGEPSPLANSQSPPSKIFALIFSVPLGASIVKDGMIGFSADRIDGLSFPFRATLLSAGCKTKLELEALLLTES